MSKKNKTKKKTMRAKTSIHVKLNFTIVNNQFNQPDDFLGIGHCTKEYVIMSGVEKKF